MWRVGAAVVGVLASCAMFGPGNPVDLIPGASLMDSPPAHAMIQHDSAQMCSGKHNEFADITWLRVQGHDFRNPSKPKERVIGLWMAPHTIYIASEWLTTDWVLRHEMVHDLLRRGHWDGDSTVFGRQCHAMWGYLK